MPASTGIPGTQAASPMEKLAQVHTSMDRPDATMSTLHRGVLVASSALFVGSCVIGFALTPAVGIIGGLILCVPLLLAVISAGALFVPRSLRRWMLGVVAAVGAFVALLAMVQAVTGVAAALMILGVMLTVLGIGLSFM